MPVAPPAAAIALAPGIAGNPTDETAGMVALTPAQLLVFVAAAIGEATTSEPWDADVVWVDSGIVKLSLGRPVSISSQPTNQSVIEGSTATFSLTAVNPLTYQWQKQESGAGAWSNVSGATSASYTTGVLTVANDNTDKYRCVVSNPAGSVNSTEVTLTVIVAPANTVAPTLSGTAEEGQTLTCSTGTWTGTATITYGYQWQRNASNISGATASTRTLASDDVGQSVRCVVTATNAAGSSSANSNAVTPASSGNTNTVAPSISGSAVVGSTLTASAGTWSGGYTGPFIYDWRADGVSQPSPSQTTYYVPTDHFGKVVTCRVYPTGQVANAATSAATGAVTRPGVRTDVKSWPTNANWLYSMGTPFTNAENFAVFTGGSGWVLGAMRRDSFNASLNVGESTNQPAIFFSSARAPSGSASGGQGYFYDCALSRRVHFCGNSLMGYGADGFVEKHKTAVNTRGDYRWAYGQTSSAGWTITNLESNKSSVTSAFVSGYARNIALVWEFTNTLFFGASKETALANHKSYCADLRAAGYYVVIMTCLPRTGAGTPGTFEADRLWINAEVNKSENLGVSWDQVIDLAAISTIGATGASDDLAYYLSDKVHLNPTGFTVVQAAVTPALLSIA